MKGRAFQAKGTASAKATKDPFICVEEEGGQWGWSVWLRERGGREGIRKTTGNQTLQGLSLAGTLEFPQSAMGSH